MKKISPFIILLFFAFFNQNIQAQSQWAPLGNGLPDTNFSCNALALYNGDVIAGGYFSRAGNISANNIARWNGNSWLSMGSGIGGASNFIGVYGLTSFQGELYASGEFDTADGLPVNGLAKWNGSEWTTVGQGYSNFYFPSISAVIVYNDKLIVGGPFDTIGGVAANCTAQWDGNSWAPMGSGLPGNPTTFAEYNGTLYAGGAFSDGPGMISYGMASWNGTEWTLFAPLNYSASLSNFPIIEASAVYYGNLYVGGNFDSIDGIAANNIALWNGSTWGSLNSGLTDNAFTPYVITMSVANNDLYVGGEFTSAGGIGDTNLAIWNGTNWSAIEGLYSTVYVSSMLTEGENIFIGGSFDTIAGIPLNNIAEFQIPTGIVGIENNPVASVFPNPNYGEFYLTLKDAPAENVITIYDAIGNKIMQGSLTQRTTELNLTNAAKGIYFYKISTADGESFSTGKIMVD